MGRRAILLIAAILFIIIIVVLLVFFRLQQDSGVSTPPDDSGTVVVEEGTGSEPTNLEPATPLPDTVDVVVSLQTLQRGWQFTEANVSGPDGLRLEKRVLAEIEGNEFTSIDDVIGLYSRADIFQGQTLTKDMLVSDPTLVGLQDYGPSSLIPEGSVASAIPMDRLSSVAYAVKEGDFVDIMITFRFYRIDEEFQTYLENAGVFFLDQALTAAEGTTGEGTGTSSETFITQDIFVISPYGRFETLPTGDLAHISPGEFQRPFPISMILQNARAIQIGEWEPPGLVQLPTATPIPAEEGQPQASPTFSPAEVIPTEAPPSVILLALSPQQQLFLKYALESQADIDLALRPPGDNQIYSTQNVDLNFLLDRFNIEVPTNFDFSVDGPVSNQSATPGAAAPTEQVPEGG